MNRWVAAHSGEATLESDKQQATTRKRTNCLVVARSGETTLKFDEAIAYYNQQFIGSPGVGDSFSFRKETTISHTATHISLVESPAIQSSSLV
jgi:hypothetical protein